MLDNLTDAERAEALAADLDFEQQAAVAEPSSRASLGPRAKALLNEPTSQPSAASRRATIGVRESGQKRGRSSGSSSTADNSDTFDSSSKRAKRASAGAALGQQQPRPSHGGARRVKASEVEPEEQASLNTAAAKDETMRPTSRLSTRAPPELAATSAPEANAEAPDASELEEQELGEAPLSEEALEAQQQMAELAEGNPRLQQMNVALERFLGLVNVAMDKDKLTAAIPNVPSADLQRLSRELVGNLKSFVLVHNAQLVPGFELDARLAELSVMVDEANERIAKGLQPDSDELKDAWRPHITDELVSIARQIPEQEADLRKLQEELAELEADNGVQEERLRVAQKRKEELRVKMRVVLTTLDKTTKALQLDTETEKRIHETVDALLTQVGPRG